MDASQSAQQYTKGRCNSTVESLRLLPIPEPLPTQPITPFAVLPTETPGPLGPAPIPESTS